jgi:hypothetical protein
LIDLPFTTFRKANSNKKGGPDTGSSFESSDGLAGFLFSKLISDVVVLKIYLFKMVFMNDMKFVILSFFYKL